MNKVILMGRLTRDPEVLIGKSGTSHTKYTLAVDSYNGETMFINCITFNRNAEFAGQYLRKGMKMLVSGELSTYKYKDDEGSRTLFSVIVTEHHFCEKKIN